MTENVKLSGIYADRIFIDNIFMYYKLKTEISSKINENENDKYERESCVHYLSAIERCLARIKKLEDRNIVKCRSYLDYIRSNRDVIVAQLEDYASKPIFIDLLSAIEILIDNIEMLALKCLKMSESEVAICNQYVHAYQIAVRKNHSRDSVYIQVGNLLLNYINILKDRYYVDRLDRQEVTFEQLQDEANFVISKLNSIDKDLTQRINITMDMYSKFRSMDDGIQQCQTKALQMALLASHKRYTESSLECLIREINEAIQYIKIKLKKKITKLVINLRNNHPITKLVNFLKTPSESIKKIIKWAKENPWKTFSIGVGIVVGSAACIYVPFILHAVLLANCGNLVIQTISVTITKLKMVNIANKEIAKLQEKENEIRRKNEEEGLRIVEQITDDERLRNKFKEARAKVFEKNKRERERKQDCQNQREQLFENMSEEELNGSQYELSEMTVAINVELEAARSDSIQSQLASQEMVRELTTVLEGHEAIRRIMDKIKGPDINYINV